MQPSFTKPSGSLVRLYSVSVQQVSGKVVPVIPSLSLTLPLALVNHTYLVFYQGMERVVDRPLDALNYSVDAWVLYTLAAPFLPLRALERSCLSPGPPLVVRGARPTASWTHGGMGRYTRSESDYPPITGGKWMAAWPTSGRACSVRGTGVAPLLSGKVYWFFPRHSLPS